MNSNSIALSIVDEEIHLEIFKRGKAIAYLIFEGMYLFDGDKSASEGILGVIAEWLNLDRLQNLRIDKKDNKCSIGNRKRIGDAYGGLRLR